MLERIAQIIFVASLILFIYWVFYIADKPFTDYKIECIKGNEFVLSHSGGIAGPIGKCNETKI